MTATMTINKERNGIELRFEGKPESSILEKLKAAGFRWSRPQKMWWAKQTDKRLEVARAISSTEEIKTAEESQEFDLWAATRTDKIENFYEKEHCYDNKSMAAKIRKHLRERFPMCKWSVTSDHLSINTRLKSSPFEKDSEEIKSIIEYANKYMDAYNYNNSDPYSDYYDVNFYGCAQVDYDYIQTEPTPNISELFAENKAEFERKEHEEFLKRCEEEAKLREIEKAEYEKREKEIALQVAEIEEKAIIKSEEFWVINAKLVANKDSCINYEDKYKEQRVKCKVTKAAYLTSELYDNFINGLLISNFSFLERMGGSGIDDLRVNGMIDYDYMTKEEKNTVEWYCDNCVAIYCDGILKLIIDPQGYSYARYVYEVDNSTETARNYKFKQVLSDDDYKENCKNAEQICKLSSKILQNNDMNVLSDHEQKMVYKQFMINQIKAKDLIFDIGTIRALPNDDELKSVMYEIFNEMTNITEQFKGADLMQGQKVTVIMISDFGGMSVSQGTFDSVEYGSYAQYDKAVKFIFKPKNKRSLYYKWLYRDVLIFNDWVTVPDGVLYDIKCDNGVVVQQSKFDSCDRQQYQAVLDYFREQNIEPIINTYNPRR